MQLKNKKINFLGDSITEGVGTSSCEHIYLNIIKREASLAEARNYGISGTRIARQKAPSEDPRSDREFVSRVEEMDSDTFYGACHTLMNIAMSDIQPKIYCPDGLHPSDAGNRVIASRLLEFLESY